MSVYQPSNLSASIRQRLLNIAKRDGEAFDLVLTRYALERLLYRLGQSQYHGQFLLKGAKLCLNVPHSRGNEPSMPLPSFFISKCSPLNCLLVAHLRPFQ